MIENQAFCLINASSVIYSISTHLFWGPEMLNKCTALILFYQRAQQMTKDKIFS